MKKEYSAGATASIGIADIFLVVFVVLKLVGVINWSWWWVLSPFWIAVAIYAIVVTVIVILYKVDQRPARKKKKTKD